MLLEITRSTCPCCHADDDGINGRYACALCNWVNHWPEGHTGDPSSTHRNAHLDHAVGAVHR
ncbi:hypothetical protein ACFYVL_42805 [Streptomyces sp. NPDC004111]|uniref:hypothetical protein n=1 Tax=Streptomyces sp. NPDC004111 TaxID=3364690 RepID=UPI0036BECC44